MLTVGACSSANNRDKLFCDGMEYAVAQVWAPGAAVAACQRFTGQREFKDWRGVIPQTSAQRVGASETEKAHLPFRDWERQSGGGAVTAWMAHDDHFFYFAAVSGTDTKRL